MIVRRQFLFLAAVFALAAVTAACGGNAKKQKFSSVTGTSSSTTPPQTSPGITYDYYVDAAAGSDANAGTAAAPFRTLTKGITVATSGQSVKAAPGTYDAANGETFPIVVPPGVQLIGDEANQGDGSPATLINGSALAGGGFAGFIEATVRPRAGSTLAGFKVLPTPATGGNTGMVMTVEENGVTLRANTITGGASNGVYVQGSSNNVFTGNLITGNSGPGIGFVSGGTGTKIEYNAIVVNTYGVELDVPAADLGGGSAGSAGGNVLSCNTINDVWTNAGGTLSAMNNVWDHSPPNANDIFASGTTVATSGASVVASPCP